MNEAMNHLEDLSETELAHTEGGTLVVALLELGIAVIAYSGALGDFFGGMFDAAGGLERSPPTKTNQG